MRRLPTSVLLLGALASPVSAECTCRFVGGDVAQGQTACIVTANGPTLARCEKVQNVTSWTFLNKACTPNTISSIEIKRPLPKVVRHPANG